MTVRQAILDEALAAYERDAAADEAVFMQRWRKIAPHTAVKHLQGQHDQSRHGSGGGGKEYAIDEHWAAQSGGGGATLVYHGTAADAAESIKRDGLQPFDGNRLGYGKGRPPSVYFSTDRYQAVSYGEGNMMVYGADSFALVRIRVPKEAAHEVKLDEADHEAFGLTENFRIARAVPPEWIVGIDIYDSDGETILHTLKAAGTYYGVVLIKSVERHKHLSGEHDQRSHGKRGPGREIPITKESLAAAKVGDLYVYSAYGGGKGYGGRTLIGELLVVNDEIRSMIMQRKDGGAIKKVAVANGMKTFRDHGMQKVMSGITTIEELLSNTQLDI